MLRSMCMQNDNNNENCVNIFFDRVMKHKK